MIAVSKLYKYVLKHCFFIQIQDIVNHGSTPKLTHLSNHGIDPPSFDLGLSQFDIEHTVGELSPNIQVKANVNAIFEDATYSQAVSETKPYMHFLITT